MDLMLGKTGTLSQVKKHCKALFRKGPFKGVRDLSGKNGIKD